MRRPAQVMFADGSTTTTVTIDPTADTTVEADETVILTVTAGAGYNTGSPSAATGTVTNDDVWCKCGGRSFVS
jgi:hypothetical protein